jgi:hypothetical protein
MNSLLAAMLDSCFSVDIGYGSGIQSDSKSGDLVLQGRFCILQTFKLKHYKMYLLSDCSKRLYTVKILLITAKEKQKTIR